MVLVHCFLNQLDLLVKENDFIQRKKCPSGQNRIYLCFDVGVGGISALWKVA